MITDDDRGAVIGDRASEYLRPLRQVFGETRTDQARRLGLAPSKPWRLETDLAEAEPDDFRETLRAAYGLPETALPKVREKLVRTPDAGEDAS